MINNIQIEGDPDTHPERKIYDANELASGKIDFSHLRVVGHHVDVFDLMDDDRRREYDDLYIRLSELAKSGKIYILANTREVLTKPDGSTGWFKYIEWTEFDTSEILGA